MAILVAILLPERDARDARQLPQSNLVPTSTKEKSLIKSTDWWVEVNKSEYTRTSLNSGFTGILVHAIVRILGPLGLKFLLLCAPHAYLRESGWSKSSRLRKAVDLNGDPLPWYPIPFIKFLDERLTTNLNVFEFGSGNSSKWYAKRVKYVVSVENNAVWYKTRLESLEENSECHLFESYPVAHYLNSVFSKEDSEPTSYAKSIRELGLHADIIVVDGIDRNNCIFEAIQIAGPKTVIILDNLEYAKGFELGLGFLEQAGFRSLSFWGIAPGELLESCTGIFYKDGNCLNI